jgi:hypothetical protein
MAVAVTSDAPLPLVRAFDDEGARRDRDRLVRHRPRE